MIADKLKHSEIKTGKLSSDKLIVEKVFSHKQEHVFRWWNDLTINEQRNLLNQLRLTDFTLLQDFIEKHTKGNKLISPEATTLEPPDIIPIPQNDSQKALSDEAGRSGKTQ
jgi:UDP-N-acetylglucosamine/UDP-N-acetylgalactosamine diphosphorylase